MHPSQLYTSNNSIKSCHIKHMVIKYRPSRWSNDSVLVSIAGVVGSNTVGAKQESLKFILFLLPR